MKKKSFRFNFFVLSMMHAIYPTALAANGRQTSASKVKKLPTVVVTSTKLAPDELPKPYVGGQMARGGRVGLLFGHNDWLLALGCALAAGQALHILLPRLDSRVLRRSFQFKHL